MGKKSLFKKLFMLPILGILFATLSLSPLSQPTYALPGGNTSVTEEEDSPIENEENVKSEENTEETEDTEEEEEEVDSPNCYEVVGSMGWAICPVTVLASGAVDTLYGIIDGLLTIEPITMNEDSSIYIVWSYARNITNIVFIIVMLVMIYSQLTGIGFDNYNVKKILPKLAIAAVLVNLSFFICSLAVDASNIVGASVRGFFDGITENVKMSSASAVGELSWGQIVGQIFGTAGEVAGVAGIAAIAIGAAGGIQKVMFLLIPVVVGALISLLIGLFTIALRQVVVALLVMISPLAFVAYLLPNTEKLFQKWLDTLKQMLVFYPLFSALFGASQMVGWTFITNGVNSGNAIEAIVGMGLQVVPLVFSFKLLKMSDTVLGQINEGLHKVAQPAQKKLGDWASKRAQLAAADYDKRYMQNRPGVRNYNPGGHLRRFLAQQNAELEHNIRQSEGVRDQHLTNYLNARDINKSLKYDENGNLIYSEAKKDINDTMKRAADLKEAGLAGERLAVEHDRALSQMGTYMKQNGIESAFLKDFIKRQEFNYTGLESQQNAKRRDDIADKQFYAQSVLKAIEKDENGNYKNPNEFNRLVRDGGGVGAFSDDAKDRNSAISSVIANAYDFNEAERKKEMDRYASYLKTQPTEEVDKFVEKAMESGDMNSLITGLSMYDMRGDDDAVERAVREYMNSGKLKAGTEDANNLAFALLQMKSTPVLRRIGKIINVETRSFTSGERGQALDKEAAATLTYDEFVTGTPKLQYVDDDGNIQDYLPKYDIVSALNGTPHKDMDRTSMQALIQSEYDTDFATEEARYNRIAEINNAIRAQLIAAMPSYDSGSEPLLAMVGYITGQKYKNGKWVADKKTNDGYQNIEHFMDETRKFFTNFSAGDLTNMKSDMFAGAQSLFTQYYSQEMGLSADDEAVKARVKTEFTKLFEGNQVIADDLYNPGEKIMSHGSLDQLRNSEAGAYSAMKPKIREYFGLS